MSNNIEESWMVLGDFNDIRGPNEKYGGAQINSRKCELFYNRIDECGFLEIDAIGPCYTWRGPVVGNYERIFEKLDRGFCNEGWRIGFPEGLCKVLPRLGTSDHNPLLFLLDGVCSGNGQRPFRFEKMWLTHEKFDDFVAEKWNGQIDTNKALGELAVDLKDWNWRVFGEIKRRKNVLLKRLGGIQKKSPCNEAEARYLFKFERRLQEELNIVLQQEELHWQQKSKSEWVRGGDRNTRYYHLRTITRRKRSKIEMLKNDMGEWVEDSDEIKKMAVEFFSNLFTDEGVQGSYDDIHRGFDIISSREQRSLLRMVSDDEVRRAMFDIGPDKAPGEDGFSAMFFQRCWGKVGESVCRLVKGVFSGEFELGMINKTVLVLISKVDKPEFVNQFRPISLCNVI